MIQLSVRGLKQSYDSYRVVLTEGTIYFCDPKVSDCGKNDHSVESYTPNLSYFSLCKTNPK